MDQLVSATKQGNENSSGIAAKDTAKALQLMAEAVADLASFIKYPETQLYIIVAAQNLTEKCATLVSEAKLAIRETKSFEKQQRVDKAASAVLQLLDQVVNWDLHRIKVCSRRICLGYIA